MKKGIRTFWKRMTPELCTHYIDHLHRVMPVVIEKDGGPSGFRMIFRSSKFKYNAVHAQRMKSV